MMNYNIFMMIEDIANIAGWAGGGLVCIMQLPQFFQTYQSKDVSGLSWGMLVLHVLSGLLWLTYGIELWLPQNLSRPGP